MISIIAAMTTNRVIGLNNQMPWHLPSELKYFKQITMGKPIIMGRKTFESIGKPLPGRVNIVITHQPNYHAEGILVADSLEHAIVLAGDVPEVMIIGGATIYQQALVLADKMYLTLIDLQCEGDAFFPAWDTKDWQIVEEQTQLADADNPYSFQKLILERN